MASLKEVGVWDIQLGMVIVKCDKAGVPFNEYGRPLSNLGYIHSLYDYGVEHVYIWDDEDNKGSGNRGVEYQVDEKDDVDALLLSSAKEHITTLQDNYTSTLGSIKMGKEIDVPALINTVSDLVFVNQDNPEVFTKMMISEGMSKDEVTHGINVCVHSISLGQAVGIEGQELQDLALAALLHDIGKVRVQDHILNKKANLTEYEMAALKRHTDYAGQVLQRYEGISEYVKNIIYQHHECCDGSGYPSGIYAQYMLRPAKVLSVTEAYNTMLTYSPEYPRAFNNVDAIKKISAEAGKKYQADIVKAFVSIMGVYPVGTAVELSNGLIGIICEVNKSDYTKPKVLMISEENQEKIELVNLKTNPSITIVKAINNTMVKMNPFEIFNNFLANRMKYQLEKK